MIHFVSNYDLQITFFSFLFICLFVCLFVSNALPMTHRPVKPNWNSLYCVFYLQNLQLTVLSDSYRKTCLVVYIGWSLEVCVSPTLLYITLPHMGMETIQWSDWLNHGSTGTYHISYISCNFSFIWGWIGVCITCCISNGNNTCIVKEMIILDLFRWF